MGQKNRVVILFLLVCGFLFLINNATYAHPGNTDKYGCHTCRTNCSKWGLSYGEYHCHRAKALPQPVEPIKSHKVEGKNGYTTPAPEYKVPKIENNKVEAKSSTDNTKTSFWGKIWSFFGIK